MRLGSITLLALVFSAVVGSAQSHWAYLAPQRPVLPDAGHSSWQQNPIDRFIFQQMADVGLSPERQAQPARLLRRIYLDLIGLPPSIAETDAFLANPSKAHYVEIVDRLLTMPGFGEKWAIGWLDLARYADSDGYQRDGFRNVWPFRDWVITALNDDMPYDRFTTEQLAGDLMPNATQSQRIATGFHRGPILNLEAGTDAEEDRIKQVVDRVNTTGTVWLGVSLACAQCHDHKYDPFSIEDYYSLAAFFNNTPQEGRRIDPNGAGMKYSGPDVDVPLNSEEKQRREELRNKPNLVKQQFIAKVEELCRELPEKKLVGLKKDAPQALALIHQRERGRAVDHDHIIIMGDLTKSRAHHAGSVGAVRQVEFSRGECFIRADDVQVLPDGHHHVAGRGAMDEHMIEVLLRNNTERRSHVTLTVCVDEQDPLPRLSDARGKVHRGRSLPGPPLVVEHGDSTVHLRRHDPRT